MKHKNENTDTLTKADFLEALTKLEVKLNIKFAEFELRIDDKMKAYNSEILSRFDSWAKELETAREDRTISTRKLASHALTLKDHGQRIKKLEKLVN